MLPRETITLALTRGEGTGPALVAFVTAGYPERKKFLHVLRAVGSAADAVEIGVPFSDPMADGVTIQRSSHAAIEHGVTLRWILDELGRRDFKLEAPILLMSYLNPLLAFDYAKLAERAAEVGVAGFIVPDLPLEESGPLHEALAPHGLALVQLVTPATPPERLERLAAASEGFVYAVARTGITGAAGASVTSDDVGAYLDAVRDVSKLPVCVGFGVRDVEQVRWLGRHADGVIVGSALVEVLERRDDPAKFLRGLRPTPGMKRLYSSALLADVKHLKNVLEQAGIEAEIRNEQLSGGVGDIPFLECEPELWVADEAYARAQAVITADREPRPEDETAWRCAHCGEINEAQFGACWNCSRPAP